MQKKNFITGISLTAALVVALSVTTSAHALTATTLMQREETRASKAAERQSDLLARIIQRGDQLISTRLESLQKLLSYIQGDKRLADADKTSLTSDVQTTVGNLQTLKTKIDADTDETTARTDAKSVVTSYRIYMVFEPKIRLLAIVGNLQTSSSTVSSLSTQVQTLLDTLKSQGKDTSAAQVALDDITKTQLPAINTALATDKTLLSNVNVNTSNPQSVFTQVRKDLATVRSEFAKIRNDIATIRATLKLVVKMSPSAASTSAK